MGKDERRRESHCGFESRDRIAADGDRDEVPIGVFNGSERFAFVPLVSSRSAAQRPM